MSTYYDDLKAKGQFNQCTTQPTTALKNMIKALSMMGAMNTEEENQRLADAKTELKRRNALKRSIQRGAHFQGM